MTQIGSVATGSKPYTVAVDPTGNHVYVANDNSSTDVWRYRIDQTTGQLTSLGTIQAWVSPISITVSRFVGKKRDHLFIQEAAGSPGGLFPLNLLPLKWPFSKRRLKPD